MTIKVLQLDAWMEHDLLDDWRFGDQMLGTDRYPEMPPVFNREGIYLSGVLCWLEVGGRAFQYDAKSFKYELRMLEAERYNQKQIDALINICNQKLATREQKQLLYDISCAHDSRRVRRDIQKRYHLFTLG